MSLNTVRLLNRVAVVAMTGIVVGGCVTQRVENIRESNTGIQEGEGIVIMAKSYHLGNETEANFID